MTRVAVCATCGWWRQSHPLWCPDGPHVVSRQVPPAPRAPEPPEDRRRGDDGDDGPLLGHAGLLTDAEQVAAFLAGAHKVYRPTDPKLIDQRPYLRFAAERGPNSA